MNIVFSKTIQNFGTIELRHLDIEKDIHTIYEWVSKPYASFWGMLDKPLEAIKSEYTQLISRENYEVFIGMYKDEPIFLMEKYKASTDRISSYYDAKDGDYGMHILVAPPQQKIHDFTWNVFSTIVSYFFTQPQISRIVVEPDIRNKKIHELNKKAGFYYLKEINLPEKKAALAFCRPEDFRKASNGYQQYQKTMNKISIPNTEAQNISHLKPDIWKKANIALVRKAISEFAHELILKPKKILEIDEVDTYIIVSDTPGITYEFSAILKSLDHWVIDETTIQKKHNGINQEIEALSFIVEFRHTLGIPETLLAVYLEEISSTLASAAYKYSNQQFFSKELIQGSFQVIEHAMTEGHPCFIANNGRIGFNGEDYIKYAPETNQPFKIYWLAGHKSKATYSSAQGHSYNTMMRKELGIHTIAKFNSELESLGLDPAAYLFMPVHPWQWNHKIIQVFSSDIANQHIIFLGESNDEYSAQQSIRTLYNHSSPEKMYTKTALSILNMGFMRGLSPYYMKSTPAITEWITEILGKDEFLKQVGFTMLGEVATMGFENTYYEVLGKTNAHNKMLSALWRESPHTKIKEQQQLMTMAAFLHLDTEGNSFLNALIDASPYDTKTWVDRYLQAYLSPLLHCFFKYELVFIPHGENLIMVMENHTPVKILMKDITEEVIVFDPDLDLPEKVQRLYAETSDSMKVLTIFTDIFDSFFRFMSAILDTHHGYSEACFWEQVADCIHQYQSQHPELQPVYERYDLFIPEFDRCCLNRLQLKNTRQMLNLADPIESLILEGTLKNPIAAYKHTIKKEPLTESV
ncbi:GNAT family N-acetyltransferase [Aquimarina addita]